MADQSSEERMTRQRRRAQERLSQRQQRGSGGSEDTPEPAGATQADAPRGGKIRASDITGLKYFDQLAPLLERLHDVGTERDRAGNRQLHFEHYCLLLLLFLFNPVVTSLRGIQQASELKKVQKQLGVPRSSLGSLSEATEVFDPDRLQEIITELGAQLKPLGRDPRLKDVDHILVAADGTLIKTLTRIAQAAFMKSPHDGTTRHAWRLHTQFEVDRHVPLSMEVTGGANTGTQDERYVLGKNLQSGRCYIMDRGYAKFALFNDIHGIDSSYVCRIRDNSSYTVLESRPLSDEARTADIEQDALIDIGQERRGRDRPNHPVRLIVIKITPHENRGFQRGHVSDGYLRLATDLLDVPAEIIALIYRYRWTIEVFFRFFKHLLGCRHLLSTRPEGIQIQAYCAIIACMLISLWTGRKPTKRTYEMICWYLSGWASQDELTAHIEKLQRQN
jgi:hypothetical protein